MLTNATPGSGRGTEQVHFDPSPPLRFAEDMAAGNDKRFTLPGVDDRARAYRPTARVFDPQPHAGGDQRFVGRGRLDRV
jgi:hypothetical protein